jgi:hypothetical protein
MSLLQALQAATSGLRNQASDREREAGFENAPSGAFFFADGIYNAVSVVFLL